MRASPALVAGMVLTGAIAFVATFNQRLAPGNPFSTSAPDKLQGPSWDHPLGTDQLGRDLLTNVIRGAGTSMRVVLAVAVVTAVLGVLLGAVSGYLGGWADDVVIRSAEMIQTVPRFFVAILVVSWFGPGIGPLALLLGLTSWPFLARVVRAETLSLREREFVGAARAFGSGRSRVIARHILPNVAPAAAVVLALTASRIVLLEAGLAFLGLGDPNAASWGALINNARPYLGQAWWMAVFPGLALTASVLGFNLLSDGLNETMNPMSEPSRRFLPST